MTTAVKLGRFSLQRCHLLALVVALTGCSAQVDSDPGVDLAEQGLLLSPHWQVAGGGPVRFSPSGQLVATGSTAAKAQLLAAGNGSVVKSLPIRHTANAAAFSPDGSLLAVGSGGGGSTRGLRMFQVASGTQLFEASAHSNGTTAVSWSPTSNTLFATSGGDRTTKLWNSNGTVIRTLQEGTYGRRINGMSFAPDGKTLASNVSGNIHIWSVSDGVLVREILTSGTGKGLAYSPDGKLISTGTELYDAGSGTRVQSFVWPSGSVTSTTFTRDGSAVVVGGEDFPNSVDDPTIRYFRVSDGAELVAFHGLGSSSAYVKSVAISPDGSLLGYTLATDGLTAVATSPF
ncbi:MAG TPA: WD40 repeat domain-containing protein [Polyangiales bacterium]|nr:WD40 repeat domain-containing protein [Polyangiales bacterium]